MTVLRRFYCTLIIIYCAHALLYGPQPEKTCFWYENNKEADQPMHQGSLFSKIVILYSNACVKQPLSERPKIGFQDQLSLNTGQKYCRVLQGEHSAILLTFIKLPFVIKVFVLSILSGCFTQVLLYYERITTIQAVPLGLQIRGHDWKLNFLFLNQNICCGYSKERSR